MQKMIQTLRSRGQEVSKLRPCEYKPKWRQYEKGSVVICVERAGVGTVPSH